MKFRSVLTLTIGNATPKDLLAVGIVYLLFEHIDSSTNSDVTRIYL